MPLGASNTYGMYQNPTSPGGYRGALYDLLRGHGAQFDYVGLDSDGDLPDADHNGYPGKPIAWFTQPVNETVDVDGIDYSINSGPASAVEHFLEEAQMTPDDVVLLLLGTNNVRLGGSAESMIADMQVLLDQIVYSAASPNVQLMKLTPIGGDFWEDGDPSRTNNDTIRLFNEGLEDLVASTYGSLGVTLIDSTTTADDRSEDGVHLNEAGYRKVAQAWSDSLLATGRVAVAPPGALPSSMEKGRRVNSSSGLNSALGCFCKGKEPPTRPRPREGPSVERTSRRSLPPVPGAR
jgi:lysophospholipase L1-like esterase